MWDIVNSAAAPGLRHQPCLSVRGPVRLLWLAVDGGRHQNLLGKHSTLHCAFGAFASQMLHGVLLWTSNAVQLKPHWPNDGSFIHL